MRNLTKVWKTWTGLSRGGKAYSIFHSESWVLGPGLRVYDTSESGKVKVPKPNCFKTVGFQTR